MYFYTDKPCLNRVFLTTVSNQCDINKTEFIFLYLNFTVFPLHLILPTTTFPWGIRTAVAREGF